MRRTHLTDLRHGYIFDCQSENREMSKMTLRSQCVKGMQYQRYIVFSPADLSVQAVVGVSRFTATSSPTPSFPLVVVILRGGEIENKYSLWKYSSVSCSASSDDVGTVGGRQQLNMGHQQWFLGVRSMTLRKSRIITWLSVSTRSPRGEGRSSNYAHLAPEWGIGWYDELMSTVILWILSMRRYYVTPISILYLPMDHACYAIYHLSPKIQGFGDGQGAISEIPYYPSSPSPRYCRHPI